MEGTEENVAAALRIENLPCSDDVDNIKDDKLVKKIKEEQMIKKIRNEIETTVNKSNNCRKKEERFVVKEFFADFGRTKSANTIFAIVATMPMVNDDGI